MDKLQSVLSTDSLVKLKSGEPILCEKNINNPFTKEQMEKWTNVISQQDLIPENIRNYKKPDYSKYVKTPEERDKHLTERMDKSNDILQEQNTKIDELQSKLDKSNIELKQLNDKTASQTLYIKELEANLRDESLQRNLAESKLSAKDWKVAFLSFVLGIIATVISTCIIGSF